MTAVIRGTKINHSINRAGNDKWISNFPSFKGDNINIEKTWTSSRHSPQILDHCLDPH